MELENAYLSHIHSTPVIKIKVCVLLLRFTFVYHDARFRERKVSNVQQASKYINTRTSKKNCTKIVNRYSIRKHAAKTTYAKLYVNQNKWY